MLKVIRAGLEPTSPRGRQLRGIGDPRIPPARIHAAGLLGCYVFLFHHLSMWKWKKGWDYPLHRWPLVGLCLSSKTGFPAYPRPRRSSLRRSQHECLFKDVACHPWRSAIRTRFFRLPCEQLDALTSPSSSDSRPGNLADLLIAAFTEVRGLNSLSRTVGNGFAFWFFTKKILYSLKEPTKTCVARSVVTFWITSCCPPHVSAWRPWRNLKLTCLGVWTEGPLALALPGRSRLSPLVRRDLAWIIILEVFRALSGRRNRYRHPTKLSWDDLCALFFWPCSAFRTKLSDLPLLRCPDLTTRRRPVGGRLLSSPYGDVSYGG